MGVRTDSSSASHHKNNQTFVLALTDAGTNTYKIILEIKLKKSTYRISARLLLLAASLDDVKILFQVATDKPVKR